MKNGKSIHRQAKYNKYQKKQYKKAHQAFKYSVLIISMSSVFALPSTPAHANIFAPILKVLLPFYDGDTPDQSNKRQEQDNNSSLTHITNNRTDNSDVGNINGIFSEISQSNKLFEQYNSKPEPNLYSLLQAEFAIERGNPEQALTLYKEQAFARDATAVFERALNMSLEYEEPEQSLAFASKWYLQNPDHVPAWFYVAHLALQAHDYDLAGNTLQRILAYDPQVDLSQILQDIFPEEENDQQLLLTTLQQLNNTENANLSILQAGLLLEKNPKIALIHANNALDSDPDNLPYITLKADILKQLNSPKDLLKFVKKARKRLPEEQQLYLYEVRYRLNELSQVLNESDNQDNNAQALELVLKANERFSDDPEITLLASLVSLDNEAYDIGERLLNNLLERPAYIDKANYYLGISAERQHRYQDAKEYFATVMQEDLALEATKKVVAYELLLGDDNVASNVANNVGNDSAYNETNNAVNRAMQALIALRTNFPIHAPKSYVLHAEILIQQNDITQVKELLAEAYTNYPDDVAIKFAYMKLLDDNTDYDQKYNLLESLLAVETDNLSYQLEFSKLLLTKNPRASQGKLLAEQIISMHYSDPRFNTDLYLEASIILAKASLENKDYQQVIDYLQTPYEYFPSLTSGLLLLQAYQGLGDIQLAQQLQTELQEKFDYQPVYTPNITVPSIDNMDSNNEKQLTEPLPKAFVPNL